VTYQHDSNFPYQLNAAGGVALIDSEGEKWESADKGNNLSRVGKMSAGIKYKQTYRFFKRVGGANVSTINFLRMYCGGDATCAPNSAGGTPRPARIEQDCPGQCDRIGLAIDQHRFRLSRLGDQADRDHRHRDLALDRLGEGQLVAGTARDLLRRMQPAARHMDEVAAARVQFLGQRQALLRRSQPPSTQSVAEMRMPSAIDSGTTALIASNTCSTRRMRFSSEPP
jgi:hypothetical protein